MGDLQARHRRRRREDDLPAAARRRLEGLTPVRGWVPSRPVDAVPPPRPATIDRDEVDARGLRGGFAAQRVRLAPSGRAVAGLALLVGLSVMVSVVAWWLARPSEGEVPQRAQAVGQPLRDASPTGSAATVGGSGGSTDGGSTPGAANGAPGTSPPRLLVHVVGAVRHPGVVELQAGARVADAVTAAGGVTRRAAASSVNLARPVVDGEQIVVQRRGVPGVVAPAAPLAAGPGAPAAPPGPIDLNTATMEQLDGLPGIGPVLAQRILDWRSANGRFSAVEELGEVSGIGEATLADLLPLVRV